MRSTIRGRIAKARGAKPAGKAQVTRSGGNVFADLGLPDAEETFAKAEIASRICASITRRKLTQAEAAGILGVDQPKVSALMRGHLDGFSSDRLLRFLLALGRDVEIVIRTRRRAAGLGKLSVVDEEPLQAVARTIAKHGS